jgi:hypothetical protein
MNGCRLAKLRHFFDPGDKFLIFRVQSVACHSLRRSLEKCPFKLPDKRRFEQPQNECKSMSHLMNAAHPPGFRRVFVPE